MPQFFFHVHDGITSLDNEGTELPDLNRAKAEAIRTCGEMIRDLPGIASTGGELLRLWATDQPNGEGNTLFTLTLAAGQN